MDIEKTRFDKMVESDTALRNLVEFLKKNHKVGDKIPNQRDLSELIMGYSRQTIREALIRLECFGYIEISHGKSSVLIKNFT